MTDLVLTPEEIAASRELLIDAIEGDFAALAFNFSDEKAFHAGIAEVLDSARIKYEREFVFDRLNRFDFLLSEPETVCGIVIEAKIKGSFASALRQCKRYCEIEGVTAVILIATPAWTRQTDREHRASGKIIRVVRARRAAF